MFVTMTTIHVLILALCGITSSSAFQLNIGYPPHAGPQASTTAIGLALQDSSGELANESEAGSDTRRNLVSGALSGLVLSASQRAWSIDNDDMLLRPISKRPTVYRVDSTIPPTLLAVPSSRAQLSVLKNLGQGSGTDKKAIVVDTINLNNMLNKAVFGTASFVSNALTPSSGKKLSPASFVCLGLPENTSQVDMALSCTILENLGQHARNKFGVGILFPYSSQAALDRFTSGQMTLDDLKQSLVSSGVPSATVDLYEPVLELVQSKKYDLIAMSIENDDLDMVRQRGLQNVNADSRQRYVVDPNGFISQTSDPKFKLYTDRSLLKDVEGSNGFAERILVHEAAATAVAQYAKQEQSLVALLAPIQDVRFFGGINGRIPRVYNYLNDSDSVSLNDVTTVLVNPTAQGTLSKSKRLRLEIGTGPETLDYQTKVADYLWFSSSPAVSLLTRVMDY